MAHAKTNRIKTASQVGADMVVPDSFQGKPNQLHRAIMKLLRAGWEPDEIASKLTTSPNPKKHRRIKREAQRLAGLDPQTQAVLKQAAAGVLAAALPEAAEGLAERAKAGRPDAAKLVFEATGFYNSRVDHNHTGEIKLTLDIPRPAIEGEAVDDAELVD